MYINLHFLKQYHICFFSVIFTFCYTILQNHMTYWFSIDYMVKCLEYNASKSLSYNRMFFENDFLQIISRLRLDEIECLELGCLISSFLILFDIFYLIFYIYQPRNNPLHLLVRKVLFLNTSQD